MKKIVTMTMFSKAALFAVLFLSVFTAHAQVPQSVCYQAVATNQQGVELTSQAIRVRLSILRGNAQGTEEWVETHNVTTDGFGLFDLMIGMGNRTGGARPSFSQIEWGRDRYFLKVEMDITGGNNFVLMGTNQMISVPYALYAERSAFTDSSRTTVNSLTSNYAIRADTALFTFNSRRSDTARFAWLADSARRATFAYTAQIAINSQNARQSDTARFAWLADSARRATFAMNAQNAVNAQTAVNATNAQNAVSAQTAVNATNAQNAVNAQTAINATNALNAVTAQTARFADTATAADRARRAMVADSANRATFAAGADRARLADSAGLAQIARTALDDFDRDPRNEIQRMTFDSVSGTLKLTVPGAASDTVNFNRAPLRAAGASIDYPFGILGDAILVTQNYTVPAGRTLFVSSANNAITLGDGRRLEIEPGMPIIPSGVTIRDCFCAGLLVPNQRYAEPIIVDMAQTPTFEFQVPNDKCFIIKSGTNGTARDMSFVIDGVNYSFYSGASASPRLVVIPPGKKIRRGLANVGSNFVITGYLLDKIN
jgi:hypothetical protein